MTESEIVNSRYTQFQKIALLAYLCLINDNKLTLENAWDSACIKLQVKKSIREKKCPELAFIALFEYGYLKINGITFSKTHSSKNAEYATILANLYKNSSFLNKNKKAKWEFFRQEAMKRGMTNVAQNNNGQLDVVEALLVILKTINKTTK